jgi:tetratricopeptide (TPR) repeat protein
MYSETMTPARLSVDEATASTLSRETPEALLACRSRHIARWQLSEATADSLKLSLRRMAGLRREDAASAVVVGRHLVGRAMTLGDEGLIRVTLRSLGQTLVVQGRPGPALHRLDQSASLGDESWRVRLAPERATCLSELARPEEALATLREAREALSTRGSAPLRALIDNAEGMLLQRLERYNEALDCLDRARKTLARKGKTPALAAIDGNRANVLSVLGRFDQATRLYMKVTAFYAQNGMHTAALQSDYNHAYLDFLRGRFQDATLRLQEVQHMAQECGDRRHAALCDLDLAEVALRLDDHEVAYEHARRAEPALRDIGLLQDAARAALFQAVSVLAQGHADAAREALARAESELETLGCAAWSAVARHFRACALSQVGQREQARGLAADAARQLRGLGAGERATESEILCSRIELEQGELDRARASLAALQTQDELAIRPWLRCEVAHLRARERASSGQLRAAAIHALRAVRVLRRHGTTVPNDPRWQAYLADKRAIHDHAVRLLLALGGRTHRARAFLIAEQARGHGVLADTAQSISKDQPPGTARGETR